MTESQRRVSAAVLSSLSPGNAGSPFTAADAKEVKVPGDWQQLGRLRYAGEIRAVMAGLPEGYATDLFGRAAAAGEQLGLALAAVRDAEVWRDTSIAPEHEGRRNMAGRALAEASGLWAVSAGHAITNVAARILRVHKGAVELDKKLQWSGLPTPFDNDPKSNLSIYRKHVNAIVSAAGKTGEQALTDLVRPLDNLLNSDDWQALMARRESGYHRLRPQTISGGVPNQNPWVAGGTTGSTMSVFSSSPYVPPVLEDVVAESRAGYDALALSMAEMIRVIPNAFDAVGVPLFEAPPAAP